MNEHDILLVQDLSARGESTAMREKNRTPIQIKPLDQNGSGDKVRKKSRFSKYQPTVVHYVTLIIIGIISWGLLCCAFGEEWFWQGKWFRLVAVAVVAWGSGLLLQEATTLPPLLAALITGMLARHFGFLDMHDHMHIDSFLRKIYPVIILGKGSLAWDYNYIRVNWRQVMLLGGAPWTAEVVVLATCTHLLLGFPWMWGFLLGSVYASVSCPVIMPLVQKHGQRARNPVNWAQLVCTAGGLDTALSVGIYGVLFSFMFYETHDTYRYAKACLALVAGVTLGVCWGGLARLVPGPADRYVAELRVLFVLLGGLLANFFTSVVGWGGTGAVAVLACNATAAHQWAKTGWKLNQNPAAGAYRVLWSVCEPVLFAFTGSYFVMRNFASETMLIGLGMLAVGLAVRLAIAALMCWNLNARETMFVCCTWIPKSIVEAVLCPLPIITVAMSPEPRDPHETVYANQIMMLLVQAILITTPVGFLLTNHLGPLLLGHKQTDKKLACENDADFTKRKSTDESFSEVVRL
ncbi:sodium/hydrogen exchanger 9B1-like isoform X2 [Aricia agestis]|uniref:sodium/hydrogen exchanger 9B1-like isoform X2 n=1 Tax=Aricia agestis TaxID=91739 RepID=UPI001C201A61|nr:sodium/hydrogen exchanger 9B1-like isoform X2 [Aricia agestis]